MLCVCPDVWGGSAREREGMGVDELCEVTTLRRETLLLDGGAEQGGLGNVVEVCPGEERLACLWKKEEVFIFSCTTLPSGTRRCVPV